MGQILFEYGYGNLEYNRGPTHTTKISVLDKFKIISAYLQLQISKKKDVVASHFSVLVLC